MTDNIFLPKQRNIFLPDEGQGTTPPQQEESAVPPKAEASQAAPEVALQEAPQTDEASSFFPKLKDAVMGNPFVQLMDLRKPLAERAFNAAETMREGGESALSVAAPVASGFIKALGTTVSELPGVAMTLQDIYKQPSANLADTPAREGFGLTQEMTGERSPENVPAFQQEAEALRKFEEGEKMSGWELFTALSREGAGKTLKELGEVPEALERNNLWSEVIGPGVGQMGFYAATRLLGGPMAPFFAAAGTTREDVLKDVREHSQDPEVIAKAERWVPALGASQIVPLETFWLVGQLQKAKGGKALTDIVQRGLVTGITEGTLEAFYEASKNYMASDSGLGYDPERSLAENTQEAAAMGGVVGFLGSVMLSALGLPPSRGMKNTFEQAFQEILSKRKKDEEEKKKKTWQKDQDAWDFGPSRDTLVGILQQAQQKGGADLHNMLVGLQEGTLANPPAGETAKGAVNFGSTEDRVSAGKMNLTNGQQEKIYDALWPQGIRKGIPGKLQTAQKTDNDYQIQSLDNYLESNREMYEANLLVPAKMKEYESKRATRNFVQARRNKQQAEIDSTSALLQDWISTFSPQGKYVLTFDNGVERAGWGKIGDTTTQGSMYAAPDGTSFLSLNLNNIHKKRRKEGLSVVGTLAHEFGHALAQQELRRASPEVQDAIMASYYEFLRRGDKKTSLKELLESSHIPGRFSFEMRNFTNKGRTAASKLTPKRWKGEAPNQDDPFFGKLAKEAQDKLKSTDYVWNFDEWFTNQVARAVLKRPDTRAPIGRFFARVGETLRRFWERKHTQWDPAETVNQFLDGLTMQVTQQSLASRLESLMQNQPLEMLTDQAYVEQVTKGLTDTPKGLSASPLVTQETAEKIKDGVDKFNWLAKWGFNLLQIAKDNPHIQALQHYLQITREWWNEGSYWREAADGVYKRWQNLGKEMAGRLAEFSIDVTIASEKEGRRLTQEELTAMSQEGKYKLSVEAMQLYNEMDLLFREALGFGFDTPRGLYEVLLEDLHRLYRTEPIVLQREIKRLNKEMADAMDRNYFPLMRFGEYTVTVRALETFTFEGVAYSPNDVVRFEAFETAREAELRAQQLRQQIGKKNAAVGQGMLTDFQQSLQGLPRQLLEAIQTSLALTPEQQAQLTDLIKEASPANSYKKHLMKRRIVQGFDLDAPRIFATYFSSFSNYIGRLRHMPRLQEAIREMRESSDAIKRQSGDATKRDQLIKWLQEHYEYINNPGNELAWLRGAGFTWYLGFSAKSAFVNLSQVPMITYPYLAAREQLKGTDKKAVKAIAQAYKKASQMFTRPEVLTEGEALMLEELRIRGIIDQSLAMELSAAREGGNLVRAMPGTFKSDKGTRALRQFSYGAAFMFHIAEKFNRRVSAIAAYDMAREAGLSHKQAVEEAYSSVETSQFEYASWNRPKFMRGKASTLFLFYMYMQNALYFGTHDAGAKRFWLMALAMAGMSGLPFAEDAMDMYDFLMTKWKSAMGKENPRVRVREDLRAMITKMGADPHFVMHGLSGTYGLGPVHLLSLAGVPVPSFDISASTSLGSVVPGLGLITDSGPNATGRAAEDVAGAAWGMPISIINAIKSDDPDLWKRVEMGMPVQAANMSRGARWALRGFEQDSAGYSILEFDMGDPMHQMEVAGRIAGFAPSRLVEEREKRFAQSEMIRFYETRRSMLQMQYSRAMQLGDKEALADVRKAMQQYNRTIPHPALALTADMVRNSVRNRAREGALRQRNLPSNLKHTEIYRGMGQLYNGENIFTAPQEETQTGNIFTDEDAPSGR